MDILFSIFSCNWSEVIVKAIFKMKKKKKKNRSMYYQVLCFTFFLISFFFKIDTEHSPSVYSLSIAA